MSAALPAWRRALDRCLETARSRDVMRTQAIRDTLAAAEAGPPGSAEQVGDWLVALARERAQAIGLPGRWWTRGGVTPALRQRPAVRGTSIALYYCGALVGLHAREVADLLGREISSVHNGAKRVSVMLGAQGLTWFGYRRYAASVGLTLLEGEAAPPARRAPRRRRAAEAVTDVPGTRERLGRLIRRRGEHLTRAEAATRLNLSATEFEVFLAIHARDLCEHATLWTINGHVLAHLDRATAGEVKAMNRRIAQAIAGGAELWRVKQDRTRREAAALAAGQGVTLATPEPPQPPRTAPGAPHPAERALDIVTRFGVSHEGGVRRPRLPTARGHLPPGFGDTLTQTPKGARR